MYSPELDWTRVGTALLAVSVAAMVQAAYGTARIADPPDSVIDADHAKAPRAVAASRRSPELDELRAMVERSASSNPFRPDRSRPAHRFGYVAMVETDDQPYEPPAAPPALRLLGTALVAGGPAIAAVEVAGTGVRIVRPGEIVGGFRLVGVTENDARFRGSDSVVVLQLSGAIATPYDP